ncbi:uncharacterized protein LOC116338976 [Contarinia nasturtii]|uniref:uncharacterized protein LOC116338976 n=1 Tax=Contarinia nasturtii TaxID=265458 RepID=UPI0012D3F3E2|nr:uncharacterized protein LOC116338976 [Contarinia nasturtii]
MATMKWFMCIVILAIGINAKQNREFRERASIYSRLTECDYYKTDDYNYTHFVELSADIKVPESIDNCTRVSVYLIGPRDAHIILSSTNKPNRDKDFVYEFLFGGYDNKRIIIRKRIQRYTLKELSFSEVIPVLRPLKVMIEISNNGHIKVYIENKPEPVIEAFDPFVLPVKYISFASYQGASNEFLYNCISDKTTIDTSNQKPVAVTTTSTNLALVSLDTLVEKCQTEETWELEYNKFHELKSFKNSQAEGYLFKLNFFVYGEKEVNVLLSNSENPNIEKEAAYKIVIGGYGAQQVIRKTVEGDDLFEKIQLKDLISEETQTRVLIQMTKDGQIEVFVGEFQYKPVVKAHDKHPVDVKYVSFASNDGARVLYFYNCDDEKASASLSPPPAPHALLITDPIENEDILAKKCKHTYAWEDVYTTAIKLDSIKNSLADGFRFQLSLFVKGVRDAQILLTTGNSLDPKDGYEIVIGGWSDSKHLIRKNGDVVAKVNEFNVLNELKPIKVVVELTTDGVMRVWTEANKWKPLLEFKDTKPIDDLSTLSFKAYYRDLDFYYGCTA